jgi:hypothetical protein
VVWSFLDFLVFHNFIVWRSALVIMKNAPLWS